MQPDAVSDVSVHPYAGLVALGTGQRHFPLPGADYGANGDEEEEDDDGGHDGEERRLLTPEAGASRLVLYKVPPRRVAEAGEGEGAAVTAMAE